MLSAKQRAAQLRAELSKAQLAVADTRGTLETWVPVHELEARHNDNAAEKIQVGTADGDGALEPAQAQQLKRRAMAELVRCRVWLQSQAGDLRHDEGVPGGLKPGVRGGVEVVGQLDISAAIDQLRGATTPDEILEAAAAALDLVGRLRERFGTVSEPGGDPGEPEADELEGETPPPNARVMFDRDFPRGGRDGVLAAPRMGEVYQYVRRNRNAKVHLTGHASVPGSKRYNRSLAQRRADVVRRMIADATGHTHVSARAVGEGSPERPHTAGNEAEAKKAQGHKPDNPTWQRVDVEVQSPSGVDGE